MKRTGTTGHRDQLTHLRAELVTPRLMDFVTMGRRQHFRIAGGQTCRQGGHSTHAADHDIATV